SWLATAKQLSEKVHHHLKEEEHKFFQQAGKILKDSEKETLGNKYLKEYKKYKKQQ
ncbi:hemerythrin domain-containing protein, partial [Acinetobacter baumannii]